MFKEMLVEAKMEDSEVLSVAKKLAKNGKNEKTKKFGQGLVDFYEKNKSFTPDQVSGLQNIMKNASFNLAESEDLSKFEDHVQELKDLIKSIEANLKKGNKKSIFQDLDSLKYQAERFKKDWK